MKFLWSYSHQKIYTFIKQKEILIDLPNMYKNQHMQFDV